jgi:dihydroorotate dehydrogenase
MARAEFLAPLLDNCYRINDERLAVESGPLKFTIQWGLPAVLIKMRGLRKRLLRSVSAFMEVGAITAQAQPGNPKPRLFRLPEDYALINRLGFNNEGAAAIAIKLAKLRARGGLPKIPLGLNLGRTKIVETKDAVADFLSCFVTLFPHGDFLP